MADAEPQATPARKKRGTRASTGPAPFLKWAGGKTQLLDEILARFPHEIGGTFVEPFVGGGAVFFAMVRHERIRKARLFDRNADLVETYVAVRDEVEAVIKALGQHRNEEAWYYEVRGLDPQTLTRAERAARTIFLNKVAFNGLYRVNSKGRFNVPFGRYKNPTICDAEGLRNDARALAIAEIACADFEEGCKDVGPGDAVYFDPPYLPLSKTSSFTSYAKEAFGPEEHARLARVFGEVVDAGAFAILSNSDVPLARELFDGFKIATVEATRNINSKGDKRGAIQEILVQGVRTRAARNDASRTSSVLGGRPGAEAQPEPPARKRR
jgi:DNA adenine methylase